MAVRGCEKRIYHVKNTESEIFDEAYFILKVGGRKNFAGPRELEKEAMRIVNGATKPSDGLHTNKSVTAKREKLKAFVMGSLVTCGMIGFIYLILWLVL
jgi:hypothetical protein